MWILFYNIICSDYLPFHFCCLQSISLQCYDILIYIDIPFIVPLFSYIGVIFTCIRLTVVHSMKSQAFSDNFSGKYCTALCRNRTISTFTRILTPSTSARLLENKQWTLLDHVDLMTNTSYKDTRACTCLYVHITFISKMIKIAFSNTSVVVKR